MAVRLLLRSDPYLQLLQLIYIDNAFGGVGCKLTLGRYQAALPDELDLRPGMKLKVLRLYDDAWGTAVIASGGSFSENGRQGAFPIVSDPHYPMFHLPVVSPLPLSYSFAPPRHSGPRSRSRFKDLRYRSKGARSSSRRCAFRKAQLWVPHLLTPLLPKSQHRIFVEGKFRVNPDYRRVPAPAILD